MVKTFLRRLLILVVNLVVLVVMLEGLLRLVDPLGVRMFYDMAALGANLDRTDMRGYALRPGTYQFSHWSVTVNPDATRYTPDTNPDAPVKVVMIGDSVTFGQGVNDDQTWVNLMARAFPNVHFINAGLSGYNSAQVLTTLRMYPDADLLVYTVSNNDKEVQSAYPMPPEERLYLDLYSRVMLRTYLFDVQHDWERFTTDVDQIAADPHVRMMTFPNSAEADYVVEHYNAALLRVWSESISFVDGHASVTGNQQVAEQVIPLIAQWLGETETVTAASAAVADTEENRG